VTQRLSAPNALPPDRRTTLRPAAAVAGSRVAAVAQWPGQRPLLAAIVPLFERLGVRVADAVALPDEEGAPLSRLELLLPPEASPETALPALEQALAAAWASRFAAARDFMSSERDQSAPVLTVVVSELRRLVPATT
jgi:glutamate dehydrogenase